ncbi:hypothetical protein [Salinicola aestuarinus]|uniref:hypothetical protein n=1 Tax=Salinicola aestuarinus TaxID=1949082 RepID=UPI0013001D57|nr:hypothetical protein [Salinicola aestuarinus]
MIVRNATIAVAAVSIAIVLSGCSTVAKTSKQSDFSYFENHDDFDDSDRSAVSTPTESSDRDASLSWECMSDGLNVIYTHGTYYGGDDDDDILVRYRIDEQEASDQMYWRLLVGNEASYIRMNRVDQFTEEAKAGSEIRLEAIDPLDGERLIDTFSLVGLSDALGKLSCYGQ